MILIYSNIVNILLLDHHPFIGGAWLNENPGKICVRPKNINQSNNNKFWPDYWLAI